MKGLKLGCVLMAAGDSKRFWGNKLHASFAGRTLIERAMDAIPSDMLHAVAVVSQYPDILSMAEERGFIPVLNDRPEDGVSRTIRLGIIEALAGAEAAMFMVADQPCLRRESIEAEIAFFNEQPEFIAAMGYGSRRGNPCIFPGEYFDELCRLRGDTGGSAVIKRHQDRLRIYQIGDERELDDTDSRQQLDKLMEG